MIFLKENFMKINTTNLERIFIKSLASSKLFVIIFLYFIVLHAHLSATVTVVYVVSGSTSNYVSVIDTTDNTVIASVEVGIPLAPCNNWHKRLCRKHCLG